MAKRDVIPLKKEELQAEIASVETKIKENQERLRMLYHELDELIAQEQERAHYISSKEIIDLIFAFTGKQGNMSMIKRWADDGHLGEVVDEKDKFWALRSKQGKKRFLYPKINVFAFLYERGILTPKYDVLDRIVFQASPADVGIIISSRLQIDRFMYTIQLEATGQVKQDVWEDEIAVAGKGG